MQVNPLPPQAYTKETLQKAYAWLLTQSASVKEMARDQNILISLYLKAQRNGEASLDTPSIQNFKQELKSLAHQMGDFQTTSPDSSFHSQNVSSQTHSSAPVYSTSTKEPKSDSKEGKDSPKIDLSLFDAKTLSAIQEIKETLNLSSNNEALRALISLGIKQFKKIQ
jgi:hypothetical protein